MQYRKDSDKAGRDARGKKYNGSARYSLPQIKAYFKHSVSKKGGPGHSPGEFWFLWLVPKELAVATAKHPYKPKFSDTFSFLFFKKNFFSLSPSLLTLSLSSATLYRIKAAKQTISERDGLLC